MLAERLDPLGHPSAGERKDQKRKGSADRERYRENHGVQPDLARGTCDRDCGQDGPGARDVHGAERDPEHESAALRADISLRDPGERLLKDVLESREDQADSDEHENDDASPAQEVLREVKQREQQRTDQREDAEADHQPENDLVRTPTRNLCRNRRICPRALGPAGEEDDRQHRDDARRDTGDEATGQADERE
jgi:hypothetical protein